MKNIAVEGCILTANTGIGSIKIDTPASINTKIDEKGVYAGTLAISISGLSGTGFTGGSGSGNLTGSSLYNTIDGQPVVLEGDQSETIPVDAITSTGSATVIPTVVTITSAGQGAVTAE